MALLVPPEDLGLGPRARRGLVSEETRSRWVAQLAGDWAHGDYTRDPWFLRQGDGLFQHWGYSRARRRRVLEGLRRLYPPEFCRLALSTGKNALVPFLLLQPTWPGQIMPLLRVGADAVDAAPWGDEQLVAQLRKADAFAAAAWELAVWANLRRARRRFEREPRVDGLGTAPDFRVQSAGRWLWLEAKCLDEGDDDDLKTEVEHALLFSSRLLCHPGRHLVLRGSERIRQLSSNREGRAAFRRELPDGLRAVGKKLGRLNEIGMPIGIYEVDDFAVIEVNTAGDGVGNSFDGDLVPAPSPERIAHRAVRMIRDAARQMGGDRGGAVAFHPGGRAPPHELAQILWSDAKRAPAKYIELRFVAVRYRLCSGDSPKGFAGTAIYLPGVQEHAADRRLVEEIVR